MILLSSLKKTLIFPMWNFKMISFCKTILKIFRKNNIFVKDVFILSGWHYLQKAIYLLKTMSVE